MIIFECSFFAIYLHFIFKADEDKHLHCHPWNYLGIVLNGGYVESVRLQDGEEKTRIRGRFSVSKGDRNVFHKIELVDGPVTTLFFTYGLKRPWGYRVQNSVIYSDHYRKLKHDNKLPQ